MNTAHHKTTAKLGDEDKSAMLNDAVFYEILFALGVSEHEASDYCVWEHLNFSRMGHARALIAFFECSKEKRKWPDDLVCEDYGFPARPVELCQEDRNRLNKDLFHLSSSRLRHDAASKPWPNTILSCIHKRSIEFVQFILSSNCPAEIVAIKSQWQPLLDILRSGHELRIERFFDRNERDSGWRISTGRRLHLGLSELTLLTPKMSTEDGKSNGG
jgi:hypothetical protein